jgi:hypothetical protein
MLPFQKQANSFARKTTNPAQHRQQRHTPICGIFFGGKFAKLLRKRKEGRRSRRRLKSSEIVFFFNLQKIAQKKETKILLN